MTHVHTSDSNIIERELVRGFLYINLHKLLVNSFFDFFNQQILVVAVENNLDSKNSFTYCYLHLSCMMS